MGSTSHLANEVRNVDRYLRLVDGQKIRVKLIILLSKLVRVVYHRGKPLLGHKDYCSNP